MCLCGSKQIKSNQIKYENEKTTTLLPRRVGHLTRQLRNREK